MTPALHRLRSSELSAAGAAVLAAPGARIVYCPGAPQHPAEAHPSLWGGILFPFGGMEMT